MRRSSAPAGSEVPLLRTRNSLNGCRACERARGFGQLDCSPSPGHGILVSLLPPSARRGPRDRAA